MVAGAGGGGARVPAAERGVPWALRLRPQLRAGVPAGGVGRRQLRRIQATVQVRQAVLASHPLTNLQVGTVDVCRMCTCVRTYTTTTMCTMYCTYVPEGQKLMKHNPSMRDGRPL